EPEVVARVRVLRVQVDRLLERRDRLLALAHLQLHAAERVPGGGTLRHALDRDARELERLVVLLVIQQLARGDQRVDRVRPVVVVVDGRRRLGDLRRPGGRGRRRGGGRRLRRRRRFFEHLGRLGRRHRRLLPRAGGREVVASGDRGGHGDRDQDLRE